MEPMGSFSIGSESAASEPAGLSVGSCNVSQDG